jgi:hypothetical protein
MMPCSGVPDEASPRSVSVIFAGSDDLFRFVTNRYNLLNYKGITPILVSCRVKLRENTVTRDVPPDLFVGLGAKRNRALVGFSDRGIAGTSAAMANAISNATGRSVRKQSTILDRLMD